MTTPQQAFAALRRAGASVADATLLTAIGGAESRWNEHAIGDVNLENGQWGPSVGVWQIRTLIAETGKGSPRDINYLRTGLDAQAKAALAVLSSQGLSAWSAYTDGDYAGYLATANKAATRAQAGARAPAPTSESGRAGIDPGPGAVPAGIALPNPLGLLGDAAGAAGGAVGGAIWGSVWPFLLKGMFAVGGMALVVVGLNIAAKPITEPIVEKIQTSTQEASKMAAAAAVA